MKKTFTLSILVLTLGLLCFGLSCRKTDKQAISSTNRENILSDNAHIIDTSAITEYTETSVSFDTSKILFKPKVGDILLASPSSKDTIGLMDRVITVKNNGRFVMCTIEPSNLNEAFRQLYLDEHIVQSFSEFRRKGTSSDAGLEVSFDNQKIADGLTLSGKLKLNFPELKIKYIKRDGTTLPDTVSIIQDFNTNGSSLQMNATALAATSELNWVRPIILRPLIFVFVPVGPIPLYIIFNQRLSVKMLPASFSGKAKCTVYPDINGALGLSYINGNLKNECKFNASMNPSDFIKDDFNLEMDGSLVLFNPRYEIYPRGYDRFKGYFELPSKLDLKIQKNSPNYSLKYNLDATIGAEAEFWIGNSIKVGGEKKATANMYSNTILEGDWDNPLIGKWIWDSTKATNIDPDGTTDSVSKKNTWGDDHYIEFTYKKVYTNKFLNINSNSGEIGWSYFDSSAYSYQKNTGTLIVETGAMIWQPVGTYWGSKYQLEGGAVTNTVEKVNDSLLTLLNIARDKDGFTQKLKIFYRKKK